MNGLYEEMPGILQDACFAYVSQLGKGEIVD